MEKGYFILIINIMYLEHGKIYNLMENVKLLKTIKL
jgi:hypothetical protein